MLTPLGDKLIFFGVQAMDNLIGEVFDEVTFDEFEEENQTVRSIHKF